MKRVLVLKAGSGAGNNLIRSLKAGDAQLFLVGCHHDRFVLKKSLADLNYIVPAAEPFSGDALCRLVREEAIDLVIPTTDADVLWLSAIRARLECRTLLARHPVIEKCQDKFALTTFLRERNIAAPETYAIEDLDDLDTVFERFAPRSRLWCRIREGTGSFGAIPVNSPSQVRSWISYWEEMRRVPPGSFTLSEYLPGSDLCVQCLWSRGTLILTKMAERLVYLDSGSPSGVSSTPALAKTVLNKRAMETCERAIRAIASDAAGIFFVDMKEDEQGTPCITEINAGRFATITNIHDLTGIHNMAALYVRLALGEDVRLRGATDFAEDYYLVRSVDTLPLIMHGSDLFDGIRRLDD